MITIDSNAIDRAIVLLAAIPGAAKKAEKTAVNKTVKGIRRYTSQKVREEYTIQSKYVTRTLSTKFTGSGGELWSKGGVNDLSYFKTNPKKVTKKKPKNGVFVQVDKSGGGYLPHAFIADMSSGHTGIFARKGRARFPIEKKSGPSTPSMLANKKVVEPVSKRMKERLEVNVEHEINAFLNGYRR